MNAPNRQDIYIYDHPESKIRFLEQTLRGKDWRATLIYDGHEQQKAFEAMRGFKKRGYEVRSTVDARGQQLVHIRHLGDGAKPSEIVHEMGLVKGLSYMIANPSVPLDSLVEAGKNLVKLGNKVMHDPARANGLIYLTAEAFLVASGWRKKEEGGIDRGKFREPRNFLQSLAYSFFLVQSATYLFVAKNNDQASFDQYKKKLANTLKEGGSAENLSFEEKKDCEPKGFGTKITNVIRHYPIQIGALFNDLGMGIYITKSVFQKRWYQNILANATAHPAKLVEEAVKYTDPKRLVNGFRRDIGGAMVSMLAFSLMVIKPKKYTDEEVEATEDKPLTKFWHKLRENPQVGSGLLTVVSSSSRISTSMLTGNTRQMIGEGIYLGGDFALLFTKNDEYGSKNSKDVKVLAAKLAEHVAGLPVVYGTEAQEVVVTRMADFLRAKTLQEMKDNPHSTQYTAAELSERRETLLREVKTRIRNQQDERLERVADAVNRVLGWAPDEDYVMMAKKLANAMTQLPWMRASAAEIEKSILASHERRPKITPPKTVKELREAMIEVAEIIPNIDKAATIAVLYDTVAPHLADDLTARPAATAALRPSSMIQQSSRLGTLTTMAPAMTAHT